MHVANHVAEMSKYATLKANFWGRVFLDQKSGSHNVRTNRYHGKNRNPKDCRVKKPLVTQGFSNFLGLYVANLEIHSDAPT